MAYRLKREEAVEAIRKNIQQQNNNVLQALYQDENVLRVMSQADIFKLWHGFIQPDSLPDKSLNELLVFFRLDFYTYHELADYSYLVDEFVESIDNKNTRYLTKNNLDKMVKAVDAVYQKDLPELSKEEVAELVNGMLADSTPTTVQAMIRRASAFCNWCIKHDKYPNAHNPFHTMPEISIEPWILKNIVKDDIDLVSRLEQAGYTFNEGSAAPPLSALAWMGFTRKQVLEIQNEDVDLVAATVCGQAIPTAFYEIFRKYNTGYKIAPCGGSMLEWYLDDLGYYLKRLVCVPRGERFNDDGIINALYPTKLTFENIRLSGILYRLYHREMNRTDPLTDSDFASTFMVTSTAAIKRYCGIYAMYKKLYWEHA